MWAIRMIERERGETIDETESDAPHHDLPVATTEIRIGKEEIERRIRIRKRIRIRTRIGTGGTAGMFFLI